MNSAPLAPLSKSQRALLWCLFAFLLPGMPVLISLLYHFKSHVPIVADLGARQLWPAVCAGAVMSGFACGFLAARITSRTIQGFLLDGLAYGTSLSVVEGILLLLVLPPKA